jgi:hypothetical protein
VICPGAQNHAKDVVVVCFGILEPFDDDRSHAVSTAITISRSIPGFAGVVTFRQEMTMSETGKAIGVCQYIDTTCNSSVDIALPERLASDLDRQSAFPLHVLKSRAAGPTSMAASPDEQAVSIL